MKSVIESKFKYLSGESIKGSFEGVPLSDAASESYFVRSNGIFTAVPAKSGGGGMLGVMSAYDFKRFEADMKVIKGHAGPISDFEFSPFNDHLLATASEDASVKLWILPEGGLTEDIEIADAELRGHAKKLILSRFHPSAEYTLATAAADNTQRIWDITAQKCVVTFEESKNVTTGMDWSHNGSLLGCINKDKTALVFDPRKEGSGLQCSTHEGARPQKIVWLGDSQTFLTTGFSKISERQFAIFDLRDLSQPLVMKRLDDYAGIPYPFYDEDTKLIFIAGRGETAIAFYQYSLESENFLDHLYSFKGKEPQKGFSFLPKRCVDLKSCEVLRGVRCTTNMVEYISFKVPRKSGTFQADLYPPCKSGQAAQGFQEWWNGQDKEPHRMDLKPSAHPSEHMVTQQRKQTFLAKLQGKQDNFQGYQEEEKKNDEEMNQLTQKIEQLNDKIALIQKESEDQLKEKDTLIEQLQEQLALGQKSTQELSDMVVMLQSENQDLKQEMSNYKTVEDQ